jgi:hypothetical protein
MLKDELHFELNNDWGDVININANTIQNSINMPLEFDMVQDLFLN